MQTQRLEYFVALATEGNFGRAAARLFISQPALSQQIQKLEEDLGVSLIDRTMRPWGLTTVGKAVFEKSQDVLREVKDLTSILGEAEAGQLGRLRIGITPSALYGPAPSLIRKFVSNYPKVRVSVHKADTSTLLAMNDDSKVDIMILLAELYDPGLDSRVLRREEVVVALPLEHPLAGQDSVALQQLKEETFCMVPRSSANQNHDMIIAACINAGFSPKSRLETGPYSEQICMVAAGIGVALVPESFSTFHSDSVVYKTVSDANIGVTTTITWKANSLDSVGRKFVSDSVSALAKDSLVQAPA